MKQPIIKTKDLILRPFKMEDAPQVAEQANDKEVSKNTLVIPYPYSVEDGKQWLEVVLKEKRKKQPAQLTFAIEVEGAVAGAISLVHIQHGHKAEIGYWLGKDYRGKKLMSRAIKEVCRYGFNELKLKRITAKVFTFNPASKRVLEKNGFELEGTLKKEAKKGSKYLDAYLMAKVK
jgi:RimJ/RimL family protein N-acetyltransferase